MTVLLGKRKRRSEVTPAKARKASRESFEDDGQDELRAIFARHFEGQFKPLDIKPIASKPAEERIQHQLSEDDEEEWSGISSQEEDNIVEVVDHAKVRKLEVPTSKSELRAFMSSKPPQVQTKAKPAVKNGLKTDSDDDAASEALNVKKDVALQQLLRESHLLDPSTPGGLNPTGKNRHKALDLRLQNIGAKSSIFKQEKMPMAHRKGILSKAQSREEKRRREAKESGTILEMPAQETKKANSERRDRGIGGPSVGRFKGGTLTLSRKDLQDIRGSSSKRGRGRGGQKKKR